MTILNKKLLLYINTATDLNRCLLRKLTFSFDSVKNPFSSEIENKKLETELYLKKMVRRN